ncbi:cell division topological specificity factor MinE [Caloranaerobacter azorensis]|uniref:Cell division topological specificity factor n=3 Tax=Caloranaerobacter azorensis TaxID=116090 RepID=A0A1M5UCY4_9FIRM|nr:cell division topological specificity factor MinE [Caloranaerobacter azorensis]KGG81176.1 cell division topological specificity factor MinE [Caloranaerobacter azorensis H53214]QIB26588.1 cell division topological specificity factor MinE [Caloranaerobacter azorensis]SHH60768.1 cell division topological specificity factor MinE [Caloranaerobacter azorensis DSM 13643]
MDLFKLFGRNEVNSKTVAKERLKLVLIHDRANVSPRFLEMIKGDIIRVISDYMDIDEEGLDIKLTRTRRESDNAPIPALVANIPIIKMKEKAIEK